MARQVTRTTYSHIFEDMMARCKSHFEEAGAQDQFEKFHKLWERKILENGIMLFPVQIATALPPGSSNLTVGSTNRQSLSSKIQKHATKGGFGAPAPMMPTGSPMDLMGGMGRPQATISMAGRAPGVRGVKAIAPSTSIRIKDQETVPIPFPEPPPAVRRPPPAPPIPTNTENLPNLPLPTDLTTTILNTPFGNFSAADFAAVSQFNHSNSSAVSPTNFMMGGLGGGGHHQQELPPPEFEPNYPLLNDAIDFEFLRDAMMLHQQDQQQVEVEGGVLEFPHLLSFPQMETMGPPQQTPGLNMVEIKQEPIDDEDEFGGIGVHFPINSAPAPAPMVGGGAGSSVILELTPSTAAFPHIPQFDGLGDESDEEREEAAAAKEKKKKSGKRKKDNDQDYQFVENENEEISPNDPPPPKKKSRSASASKTPLAPPTPPAVGVPARQLPILAPRPAGMAFNPTPPPPAPPGASQKSKSGKKAADASEPLLPMFATGGVLPEGMGSFAGLPSLVDLAAGRTVDPRELLLQGESEFPSDSDEDGEGSGEVQHVILCQYEKVTKSKDKWRLQLKAGIARINHTDFVFGKCTAECNW